MDPISIRLYPVAVSIPAGPTKQKVLKKLEEMQREIDHIRTALAETKRAVATGDSRALASGVMDTRNWTISLAESQGYLQSVLRPPPGSDYSGSSGAYFVDMLFSRAVKLGIQRGEQDRA